MNSCPTCHKPYPNPNARFCPHCGKGLPPTGAKANPHVTTPMARGAPTNIVPAAQAPAATHQLGADSRPWFGALPVGELIGTGNQRYEVLDILEESPDQFNLYRVKAHRQRPCERCQTANPIDSKFCGHCGAPLVVEPVPTFRLQEAAQEATLARKIAIVKQGLQHVGLVNIYTHFVDQPFNKLSRYYVVMDDIPIDAQERTLATRGRSQPTAKVLHWGRQIADALTYLNKQQVRLPRLDAEQILILDNDQVKLRKLESVIAIPLQDYKRTVAEETRQLASLLQAQLQGQSVPSAIMTALTAATAPNQTLFDTPQQLIEALGASQSVASPITGSQSVANPIAGNPITGSQTTGQKNINLLVGRLSDVGQQRQLNEDSMLTLEMARVHNSANRPIGLYVVADGMGGHEGGEVASKLAANTLADTLWPKLMATVQAGTGLLVGKVEPDYKAWLAQGCQAAAKAVYDQARKLRQDMGTTLVAALVVGNHLYAANIGDSRLYKIKRSEIKRITEDHSMVERLVKHQMLSPEEARHHPQANLIYRSLGDRPTVEADIFEADLQAGDSLLLCSDGLSGQVEDQQMHALVMAHPPQDACQQLVQAANAAGGPDNITVIIIRIEAIEGGGA